MIEESPGELESQSLWYKYKTKVWLEKSKQMVVVHNIMRTLRAVRNWGNVAYASVPITSGMYFYLMQLDNPAVPQKELLKDAIERNYLTGWKFVEELKKRRNSPIIYPADLTPAHQQWEQDHFQALWLSIIAEFCSELHMSQGWEYSNGGCE